VELIDLARALRRHWLAAAIGFFVVMVPALAAAYVPSKKYASHATVGVYVIGDAATAVVNSQVQNRVEDASSRKLAAKVSSTLPATSVLAGASITASSTEYIINLTAKSSSAQAAMDWVNGVADALVESPVAEASITVMVKDRGLLEDVPVSPQTKQLLGGGILVGLIAALVASAIAFRLQAQLDPAETVRTRLGSNLLGELPGRRFRGRSHRLVVPLARTWPAGLEHAVQRLSTSLEVALLGRGSSVIAVAALDDSTPVADVAALIGWTLANGGTPVAIIDADVTHPAIHERFGIPLGQGLSDLLGEGGPGGGVFDRTGTFPRHVVPTEARQRAQGHLEVVSAGTGYFRPAEVMSRRLPLALAEATRDAEVVLTVCPSLEDSPEAWLAIASNPLAVLVVDSSLFDIARLAGTVTRLREQKVELLGIILTDVKRRRGRRARVAPRRVVRTGGDRPAAPARARKVEATTRR
jgi:Mrp family chromosome partitioning ATPase/capsular polysaccharide biosynthesis protein